MFEEIIEVPFSKGYIEENGTIRKLELEGMESLSFCEVFPSGVVIGDDRGSTFLFMLPSAEEAREDGSMMERRVI